MPADQNTTKGRHKPPTERKTVCRKPRDDAFLTEVTASRTNTELSGLSDFTSAEYDVELERELTESDNPPRKLGADDIKMELYRRECRNLHVTPLDSCITTLNLERNALGAEGLRNLMEALIESCSITHLNLSHNELGSTGAAIMGKILMSNHLLRSVTLSGNQFRDSDAEHFTRVLLERKTLKELNLSENELGDGAAAKFGHAVGANDSLECLDLSWNHIRPKGGCALLNGVKENVGLKRLRVSHNGLGDAGCKAVAQALANNSSLQELDIAANRITNQGITVLVPELKHNDTLQVLKVGDNLVTESGAQVLVEAIFAAEDCAIHTLDLSNINVYDRLVFLVKEHAESRPLNVVHSKVTRYQVDLDVLERNIKEDILANARLRDGDDSGLVPASGENEVNGGDGQQNGEEKEKKEEEKEESLGASARSPSTFQVDGDQAEVPKKENQEGEETGNTGDGQMNGVRDDDLVNGYENADKNRHDTQEKDEIGDNVENPDVNAENKGKVDNDHVNENNRPGTSRTSSRQSQNNKEDDRAASAAGLADEESVPSNHGTPTGDVETADLPAEDKDRGSSRPQSVKSNSAKPESRQSLRGNEEGDGHGSATPRNDTSGRNSVAEDGEGNVNDT